MYNPKYPQKYKGTYPIVYRSAPELKMFEFLDLKPFIIEWSSESCIIPYIKPTDGKMHRYFPDFFCKFKNPDGSLTTYLLEYKPYKQTIEPVKSNKKSFNTVIRESVDRSVNKAKWQACKEFCKQKNWKFMIITEKDLG